ncbi:MAG: family 78 glycoside hydrolase catalytic domain [Clostridiales bacterium]|nr:family 78 glycoside hydrolase catalytic domain [Clostridiales bacterium]
MFKGKFITLAEFAYLTPLDLFHRDNIPQSEIKYSHPAGLKNVHITFKRTFSLDEPVSGQVIARFSADDYCKLYVNGRFAAQGPAQGYYFDYNWNEIDITSFLKDGENEICAEVYYQGLINRAYDSGDLRCGFICDILNGDNVILSTDESWQCRVDRSYVGDRTTGYETQFLEDRDLRIPPTEWERVRVREHDYTFSKAPIPVLDVYEVEPKAMVAREGSTVYDFGSELVGTLRLTVRCNSTATESDLENTTTIELRAAEELAEGVEGQLNADTQIRFNTRANCSYSELVTLAEGENLIDQYEYKAFRYAEVVYPSNVEVISFCAVARNFPFDESACRLDTSDDVLSKVFEVCKRGVKLGSQEVYVDCPGREKGQYAGDLTITSASQLWLTGDTTLFCKAVRNQVESAFIDDGLMAVTPGSFMQEIADYSLQFPILALRYYDFTGDRDGLRELLEVCDKLLTSFERFQREDGLLEGVDKWNLVDWPANLRDNYDFEMTNPIGKGVHNVINAFYIGAVVCTEKIIDILDIKLEDGARRSGALIEAYNRCFWRQELGLYVDSETSDHASLHSNVLPVYFGFAKPESHSHIAELIRRRGFSSGVYMAYFTLKALAKMGLYSDVYNMLTSTGESSWYNMVREGATTCFEAWGKEQKWNTSLCHPWASAPISVLIEDIIGISPKTPGFGEVDVRPHIPMSVDKLDMRIPLVSGKHIEFEWERGFYNYRILK